MPIYVQKIYVIKLKNTLTRKESASKGVCYILISYMETLKWATSQGNKRCISVLNQQLFTRMSSQDNTQSHLTETNKKNCFSLIQSKTK